MANLFEVKFEGRHQWELSHTASDLKFDKSLMRVTRGRPTLPQFGFESDEFLIRATALFPRVRLEKIENLRALANAATKAGHGGVIVISGHAAQEARRLRNRSTTISPPIVLRADTVQAVTAIDGAVLVSPDGKCHAIASFWTVRLAPLAMHRAELGIIRR
jgi:hypothetical protein